MSLRKVDMSVEDWTKPRRSGTGLEMLKTEFWPEIVLVEKICRDILARNEADYQEIKAEMKICEPNEEFVSMPVFTIQLKNGSRFHLLSNSGSWLVSVSHTCKVKGDFSDIFNPEKEVDDSLCFEEFPVNLIFPSFSQNQQCFTFKTDSDYDLAFFFFLFSDLNL